ncbi:MAG: YggS family pyridoxal phosphate-dependent enzyme [Planctomycetota bacterium]|nr:YggS family pyridoxal phosphate-dependent enzyme [Planctomycetota bacterium]
MSSDPSTSDRLRPTADGPPSVDVHRGQERGGGVSGSAHGLIRRNLDRVRERIQSAAASAGRPAPSLVAVTKTVNAAATVALVEAGAADLGENRAAPFAEKADALEGAFEGTQSGGPRWHFIGHLQRNKARRVLERAHVLHSVDTPRLAKTITRICDELRRPIEVFVEVNLTGEGQKHGHAPEEVGPTLDILAASRHVHVLGLMAMGPTAERGDTTTESVFESARAMAAKLEAERGEGTFHEGLCRLSMGMSGDLELAIHHGATHVRIGSALFEGLDETHRR